MARAITSSRAFEVGTSPSQQSRQNARCLADVARAAVRQIVEDHGVHPRTVFLSPSDSPTDLAILDPEFSGQGQPERDGE